MSEGLMSLSGAKKADKARAFWKSYEDKPPRE